MSITANPGATGSPEHLRSNEVGLFGIVTTGLATVAPATSVVLTLPVLAAIGGASVPLIFVIATIGILATGFSLSRLTHIWPSAGSFVTFIARTMGSRFALFVAASVMVGLIVVYAGVYYFVGDYLASAFFHSGSATLSTVLTIAFIAVTMIPVILGIEVGLKVAATTLAIEIAVIIALGVAVLVGGGAHGIGFSGFELPSGGFQPIGLGFASAVLAFTGFEYCVPLAEETRDARRTVPLAVILSIVIVGGLFVFSSWTLGIGFQSSAALAKSTDPLGQTSATYLGFVHPFIKWMVAFSFVGFAIGLNSAFARVIYRSATVGLFPRSLGSLSGRFRTPALAALAFVVPPVVIGGVAKAMVGTGKTVPLFITAGTMLIIAEYVLVNVAVIVVWVKTRKQESGRGVLAWVAVPAVGVAVLGLPYYYSLKPGQPSPLDLVPWVVLATLVLAGLYTAYVIRTKGALVDAAAALLAGETEEAEALAAVSGEPSR